MRYQLAQATALRYLKFDRIGGHTATYDVQIGTRRFAVDTGFIVYNDRNYPNLIQLFDDLGVANKPTSMGFSVATRRAGWSMR